MSQSIRDAVEETENIIGSVEYYEKDKPEYVKALRTLLSLASRVEKVLGMVDRIIVDIDRWGTRELYHDAGKAVGYNQALKEVKEILNGQY